MYSFIAEREAFLNDNVKRLADLDTYLDILKKYTDHNTDEWFKFRQKREDERKAAIVSTLRQQEEGFVLHLFIHLFLFSVCEKH